MSAQGSSVSYFNVATTGFMALALMGMQIRCAKAQTMDSAAYVPASQGTVSATLGDNGNTNLSIRVKHLAPPWKVAPDATIYVAWAEPLVGAAQNIGALTLNDNLEGSLNTVTPHRRFLLSVTPEANGLTAEPTHGPVFTSEINRAE